MSPVLVTETASPMIIVPLAFVEVAAVIFPLSVTKPQVPPVLLKVAEFAPMFNTVFPSPNCMVQSSPLASVRMALITFCIAPVVPTVSVPFLAVNDVPLPVMMYRIPGSATVTVKVAVLPPKVTVTVFSPTVAELKPLVV